MLSGPGSLLHSADGKGAQDLVGLALNPKIKSSRNATPPWTQHEAKNENYVEKERSMEKRTSIYNLLLMY